MDVFLVVRALDVNVAPPAGAKVRVGFDHGPPLPVPETRTGEFEVQIPQTASSIRIVVSQAGAWDTVQDLSYTGVPLPTVAWAGAQALGARSFEAHSRSGGDFVVIVQMVAMQLRDAQASVDAAVTAGGITYMKPQPHVIRDLDDKEILDKKGKGWNQLRHVETGGVLPTGKLYFAERQTVPKLFAIYRPHRMARVFQVDRQSPVHVPIPFHLFFHPVVPATTDEYPYGRSYVDRIARYCVYPQIWNIGKAMVNQHHHSPDPCVFVFPVGKAIDWFGTLAHQSNLMRFFEEAAYFVQRMDNVSIPMQPVGRCAISAFSAGAEQLWTMFGHPDARFERHLREVYAFDPYLPGREAALCKKIGTWFQNGADERCFRMYTQSDTWWTHAIAQLTAPTLTKGPENAQEAETSSATVLHVPFATFWDALGAAIPKPWPEGTIDLPPRDWDAAHQLIPALFMSHARKKGRLMRAP
jgi:hypothetical protein